MQNDHSDVKRLKLHKALITISHSVRRLHELLHLKTDLNLSTFQKVLDSKLIVQLDPDYPLMVAVTGGGSTGKSSLFNALVGKEISAVKAQAGHSRRVLAGMHPAVIARHSFLESLFSAFDVVPEPLNSIDELTTPGVPKYVLLDEVPSNMVLLDTPDFDTGDRENYANRDLAKTVLESCDVLVYIFTNATYNNRDNTNFMRQILTGIGNRKVALVYRCSKTLSEKEVVTHSETVARNLYGEDYEKYLVGVYRANEDDEVASGHTLMSIAPAAGFSPFPKLFASLDPTQTRADFIGSALRDVCRDVQVTLDSSVLLRKQLELYCNAVKVATDWATTESLKSFPNAEVMKRFLEIWEENAPRTKKILKGFGKVVTVPGHLLIKGFKRMRQRPVAAKSTENKVDPKKVFRDNLQRSANELRNKLLCSDIAVDVSSNGEESRHMIELAESIRVFNPGLRADPPIIEEVNNCCVNIRIERPAALETDKLANGHGIWKQTLLRLCDETSEMGWMSEHFDQELNKIAKEFRAEMGTWDKTSELLFASGPALATAVAVTYVFGTADFVGGATIQAKMVSLFGLNDLWAVFAIPAGTGLNAIQRGILARLLSPISAIWLNEKSAKIRDLLQKYVSGTIIDEGEKILEESKKPFDELADAIEQLPKETDNA